MAKRSKQESVDFVELRRRILTAVVSDDVLFGLLVLKGGNALELIHRIGQRASLDLDFSMEGDVADVGDLNARLKRGVEDRLDAAGFVVFDWQFGPRPSGGVNRDPRWGGYRAEFKLISRTVYREVGGDIEAMRRRAEEIGPGHLRTFTIEISKFEFCRGSQVANVEHYECHVYTPAMIAAEKLRAICQQMPEYRGTRTATPRPRDFYDIYAIAAIAGVRLADELDLLRNMFDAKTVPYELVRLIPRDREREFHRQGWEAVVQAVRGEVQPFDFYFEFLASKAQMLHALWKVDPPRS